MKDRGGVDVLDAAEYLIQEVLHVLVAQPLSITTATIGSQTGDRGRDAAKNTTGSVTLA